MQTTHDLLDAVKAKSGISSDYALSKVICATRSSISRYRNGKETMGDDTCIRVAEILGIPAAYVFAIAHAERAREERVRVVWQELAKKLSHAAPIMAGAALIPLVNAGLKAGICILCKIAEVFTVRRIPA